MRDKVRIGALISGSGTNLQAIIDACESGKINGEVVFAGSDRPGVYGLERAKKHGISNFVVNYSERLKRLKEARAMLGTDIVPKDYDFNDDFKKLGGLARTAMVESELLKEMAKYQYDLLVLAGFMRVLSPYFIDRVNTDPARPRIMNIHPALLPSFPGTRGYEDTWEYGCRVYGCTVHFVDYGEDTGPIIWQQALTRRSDDDFEAYKQRGLETEWKVFPFCIKLFAEGRLRVRQNETGRKVVDILGNIDLMAEITGLLLG